MTATLKSVARVTPLQLPLTHQAGRIALLCGITAGTVTREEVEAAVILDTTPRPRKKPVVAYGKRFNSITLAAITALGRPWHGPNYARALDAEKHRIARLCNGDKTVGFYWAE